MYCGPYPGNTQGVIARGRIFAGLIALMLLILLFARAAAP